MHHVEMRSEQAGDQRFSAVSRVSADSDGKPLSASNTNPCVTKKSAVCTNRGFQGWPVTGGDIVVRMDERNTIIENRDIYGTKPSSEE